MKYKNRVETRQNGYALALVLIFMTVILLLGSSLLLMSEGSAKQGASVLKTQQHYYAAESAAQLGAQMLAVRINDPTLFASVELNKDALQGVFMSKYSNIQTTLNGLEFNEKAVNLDDLYINGFLVTDKTAEFTICIPATSAGITVEARIDATATKLEDNSLGFGAYFGNDGGGIFGAASEETYNKYIQGLNTLLSAADADYAASSSIYSIIDYNSGFPFGTSKNYTKEEIDEARFINTGPKVVLGADGEVTVYENLEYINSSGLDIRGTVYCPNLKGVYIGGGSANIYGTFFCPKLENLYLSGNLTIEKGAKINPMEVIGGEVINQNQPISGGCNFYISSVVYINSDSGFNTELNWCKFYASNIEVNYWNSGKLTTNSIYISRNWLKLNGTASSDISRVIPQFYMRGYMYIDPNIGTLAGIFMTPDSGQIVNNGNNLSPGQTIDFKGLFVGNYNIGFGETTQWYLGYRPLNATVEDLEAAELELMMNDGWLRQFMPGYDPNEPVSSPGMNLVFDGNMSIRESGNQ